MKVLAILPWYDWAAVIWFFAAWSGYAWFARHRGAQHASLLQTTNRYRRYWMLQATARDPRVLDGIITQTMSTSPSFFASTTIIIIGGLLALLGTTDKAADFVREIPFAVRTTMLVFDLKVLVLLGIFVYAFFRFSWSMRQYTFAALVIGSMCASRREAASMTTAASSTVHTSPTGRGLCWAWLRRPSTTGCGRITLRLLPLRGFFHRLPLRWLRGWWY